MLLPLLGFRSGDIDGVYLIYACSEVYDYVRVKHRLQDISVYQSLSVILSQVQDEGWAVDFPESVTRQTNQLVLENKYTERWNELSRIHRAGRLIP